MRTRAVTTTGTPKLMRWPGSFRTTWLIRCKVYSSTLRGKLWDLNVICGGFLAIKKGDFVF